MKNNPLTLKPILSTKPYEAQTLPSLFISHGSPTIAIEQSTYTQTLQKIGKNLPKPQVIIIMSAHWQSETLQINANPVPATWHDFGGFPAELYELDYPADGQTQVAESLATQLADRGVAVSLDSDRPLDHGVWTPLLHMYPNADVPIVQISLPYFFDAVACYQLGQLLAPLRSEQVLIMGSGSITHNLRQVRFGDKAIEPNAQTFKNWVVEQLRYDVNGLFDWQNHALASHNHPTLEHFLPLFFARGAGEMMSVVHESFAHYSLTMDIYRFD